MLGVSTSMGFPIAPFWRLAVLVGLSYNSTVSALRARVTDLVVEGKIILALESVRGESGDEGTVTEL